MSAKIHRAHVFACEIGADTRDDLVRELHFLAERIARDEITAGVMGGYGAGAVYAYRHDPNMTHDEYFRQIQASLNALQEPKP